MDSIKEQMDLSNEISEAISNPVGMGTAVDEVRWRHWFWIVANMPRMSLRRSWRRSSRRSWTTDLLGPSAYPCTHRCHPSAYHRGENVSLVTGQRKCC